MLSKQNYPIRMATFAILMTLSPVVFAQNIGLSSVRAAGAICGAGLAVDVQGDLDARIAKVLGGVSAEGDVSVDIGKASDLLASFESEDRGEAFKTYASCVIQTVSAMMGVALAANLESESPRPKEEVSIENLMLPAPLSVIKSEQRFQMRVGDVRAIISEDTVFSIYSYMSFNGSFGYRISNFIEGSTESGSSTENKMISVTQECVMLPYEIDAQKKVVLISFMLRCNK